MTTLHQNYYLPPPAPTHQAQRNMAPDLLDNFFFPENPPTAHNQTDSLSNSPPKAPPSSTSSVSSQSDASPLPRMATTSPFTTKYAPPTSIHVPRSNNPFGADAIHPKKKIMKKQRKRRAQRKCEQRSFQNGALQSNVYKGSFA